MDNICAGIVSYNPDINRLKQNIYAICSQVSTVYIVDNGSKNLIAISSLMKDFPNVSLISNVDNAGIAKALNQLCEAARTDNYEWILTLDQDTICPINLIDQLSRYINRQDAGIICPAVMYEGWDSDYSQPTALEHEEVKACMTSGSLTRLEAWNRVKGFREEYFIDFVDNEFCMKLRIAQYKIIRVNTCAMRHQLGEPGAFNFLGIKKIKYTKHAPWRFYFMVRNNRIFIEEYKEYLPVLKEYLKLWYILSKGLLFAKEKRKTFYFILKGYRDGRAHRLGTFKEKP